MGWPRDRTHGTPRDPIDLGGPKCPMGIGFAHRPMAHPREPLDTLGDRAPPLSEESGDNSGVKLPFGADHGGSG
jgi:hypothetical protein